MGVTCDAGLAVARGVWRKLRSGRSVPISSQLRSHRLFSENWERLAHLVDAATLYHTGRASWGLCGLLPESGEVSGTCCPTEATCTCAILTDLA